MNRRSFVKGIMVFLLALLAPIFPKPKIEEWTQVVWVKDGFNGTHFVDEIMQWDRILTKEEILYLYNEGSGKEEDWQMVVHNNKKKGKQYLKKVTGLKWGA